MTMTLEKIQGMNLQVGTPIEMTLNRSSDKEKENDYKEKGYFKELKKVIVDILPCRTRYYHLIYNIHNNPEEQVCGIDDVMDIVKI